MVRQEPLLPTLQMVVGGGGSPKGLKTDSSVLEQKKKQKSHSLREQLVYNKSQH